MPPKSSAEAGSWPPLPPVNSTRPDVEIVFTGPPNHEENIQTNAEPTCEASCQYSPPNHTELIGVTLTNFLADEATAFNTRFAEAQRLISGYIDLLAGTTDHQLRRAVENNGEALQAMVVDILRGNPNKLRPSGLTEAASGSKTTQPAVPASRPGGKNSASTPRPVQISARESSSQAKSRL